MTTRHFLTALLMIGTFVVAAPAVAAPQIGQAAPAFSATDTNGKGHNLADFKGKYVVLEWTNHECPFVVKHYGSSNMQNLQKETTAQGVVWLSINSSAEGKQGYVTAAEANELTTSRAASPTAVLLDPKGELGKLYDAKVTPHMFVINPEGVLIYNGAIDSVPSARAEDIATAVNYVRQALAEAKAGKPVSVPATKPYGCSVKY